MNVGQNLINSKSVTRTYFYNAVKYVPTIHPNSGVYLDNPPLSAENKYKRFNLLTIVQDST